MTNKINGIDVSEWELKGVLIPITECKYFEGIGDCKETKGLCVSNGNCYFKQLKRLQEENEELKKKKEKIEEDAEYFLNGDYCDEKCNSAKNELKYKQALEEIREIAKHWLNNDWSCFHCRSNMNEKLKEIIKLTRL